MWGNLYQEINHKLLGDHFFTLLSIDILLTMTQVLLLEESSQGDEDMREPERENSRVNRKELSAAGVESAG